MSKKHYIALAALLKDLADTTADPTQAVDIAVRDFADELTRMLKADNPAFDRQRFLEAAGFGA